VHRLEGEGLEDQEVDGAAEGIGLGGVAVGHGRVLSLEVERRIGYGFLEVKRYSKGFLWRASVFQQYH
jgi:hypothetical protein